ncbi:MAG TPA: Ig-like domain-containing protein, partial [Tepidisphaeraceae bacterium]|nr:Ig-like domain-containing protein [Tepidisphaeraceae bacterium]
VTLPGGWSSQDIGNPGSAGSAGETGGLWEVIGGGAGIAAGSDQFHYAYRTLDGDGTITAQVLSVPNASPANNNAKAGVMIRAALTNNAANAFVALTPGSVNGAIFQTRTTTGATTSTAGQATTGVWPPYWLRLTRTGNTFTAYVSPDGIQWTQLGDPQQIVMNSSVFIGLAVTSSDNSQLNISTFGNVSITTPDTTAPAVQSSAHQYETSPNTLALRFSEDVSTSLSISDLTVELLGTPNQAIAPTGYSYEPASNTATFVLPAGLADGNYRATLAGSGVTDPAGNPLAEDHLLDFFVLAGDANHDRTVNSRDLYALAANWMQSGRTFSQGNFNYDGIVNVADQEILIQNWQMKLAPPGAASPLPSQISSPFARPAPSGRLPTRIAAAIELSQPTEPTALAFL